VDERFWWWMRPVTVESTPASWSALLTTLATAAGVSVSGDTSFEAEWLSPTDRWKVNNVPVGPVLDALAASTGRRFVRRYDGTCRLELYTTSRTLTDATWETTRTPPAARPGEATIVAGGRIPASSLGRSIPAQLAVVFGKRTGATSQDTGTVEPTQYVVRVNASAVGVYVPVVASGQASAAAVVNAYPGIANLQGRFTADQYARWSGAAAGDPDNKSALDALAARAASAWYGWRFSDVDATFPGVANWTPDGYSDTVRWAYDQDDCTTRVRREPYFNWNVYGHYPTTATGGVASSVQYWGKVSQILSGHKYVLRQVVLSGTGVPGGLQWREPADPLVVTGYRADSKDYDEAVLPYIPVGQQVQMNPSPTVTGVWELPAFGGELKTIHQSLYDACVVCDGDGNLILSGLRQAIGHYARDLRTVRFPAGTGEYHIDASGAGY
jgi:hypothetical protein